MHHSSFGQVQILQKNIKNIKIQQRSPDQTLVLFIIVQQGTRSAQHSLTFSSKMMGFSLCLRDEMSNLL